MATMTEVNVDFVFASYPVGDVLCRVMLPSLKRVSDVSAASIRPTRKFSVEAVHRFYCPNCKRHSVHDTATPPRGGICSCGLEWIIKFDRAYVCVRRDLAKRGRLPHKLSRRFVDPETVALLRMCALVVAGGPIAAVLCGAVLLGTMHALWVLYMLVRGG